MKYAIIVGSHREDSQSSKVGHYIAGQLQTHDADIYLFDLKGNPLPLWDESAWKEGSDLAKTWHPVGEELSSCDAVIVIAPEWGGMVPAGLKNFFLFCGPRLAHKPGLIVSVSAGGNGAYPVAELRMSSYKNTHINFIPEHIIVRHVNDVLNDNELREENKDDFYIKKRISYALKILEKYAEGAKVLLDSDVLDLKTYPYGM